MQRNDRVAPTTQVRSPARSFLQATDNFYAPARDRRGAEAIQRGISAINSVLEERFVEERASQRDEEFQQGAADALREQAGEEMLGVQTGNIFRQNSRFYMAGLNETRGRAAATEFRRATEQAWAEWDQRDADDDGTLFRDWMNSRLAEFVDTLGGDRHRLAGALPAAQQVANSLAQRHATYTDRRIAAAAAAAHRQIHNDIWNQVGTGEGQLSPDEALLLSLGVTEEEFDLEGGVANRNMVEAMIDYANVANDPTALLTLESAVNSGRVQLGLEDRARLSNGIEQARADADAEARRVNAALEAEREAQNRQVTMDLFNQAMADPWGTQVTLDAFNGDLPAWNAAQTMLNTIQAAAQETDPMVDFGMQLEFTAAVQSAPDMRTAIQSVGQMVTSSGPGYAAMGRQYLNDIIEMSSAESLLRNPVVSTARDTLSNQIGSFENSIYTRETVSTMQVRGQHLFDLNLSRMAAAGEINGMNTVDILEATNIARERTLAQLVNDFPDLANERAEGNSPETRALGIAPFLEEYNTNVEAEAVAAANAEAARIFAEDAAAAAEAMSSGPVIEDLESLAAQEAPFTPDEAEATGELFEDIPEPPPAASEAPASEAQPATAGRRREWVNNLLQELDARTVSNLTMEQLQALEETFNVPLGTFTSNSADSALLAETIRFIAEAQQQTEE